MGLALCHLPALRMVSGWRHQADTEVAREAAEVKNCRDCDEPSVQSSPRRADICLRCWNVRQNVMRAVTAKTMPLEDFQRYQKNGLRTKRLVKMGYGSLVPEQSGALP